MKQGNKCVLSRRLQTIAEMVPKGSRMADVGTDHGYLPVYLLQHKMIDCAIACDVGEAPLNHARHSATQYGISQGLIFRQGDGLMCLDPDEVDVIVIAGMGGETISSILSASPWCGDGSHRMVLQPMTKQQHLRLWLSEHGFAFIEEHLVYENRGYFPIFSVVGSEEKKMISLIDAWGGVLLAHDPLQGKALEHTIRSISRALMGLSAAKTEEHEEKIKKYDIILKGLIKRKEDWEHDNCKGN